MAEINVGQISEALNNKADLDLNNTQPFADYVIEWKAPTSSDPTWYRKYKSGWVEQGGTQGYTSISGNVMIINLLVEMADKKYFISMIPRQGQSDSGAYYSRVIDESSTTQLKYYMYLNNSVTTNNPGVIWEVKGFAAQS